MPWEEMELGKIDIEFRKARVPDMVIVMSDLSLCTKCCQVFSYACAHLQTHWRPTLIVLYSSFTT